jgi:hypothetical protein
MTASLELYGIIHKFGEEPPKRYFLTSFEVLRIEEVEDDLLRQVGKPYLKIFFRPHFALPQFELRTTSICMASTWARQNYKLNDLFPLIAGEYHGFPQDLAEGIGESQWRSLITGRLFTNLADAHHAAIFLGRSMTEVLG